MARNAGIARKQEHGWQLGQGGLLSLGTGSTKVEARPTALLPSRHGEPDFNPAVEAFALKLGADFVGPNRYRAGLKGLLLDANGACRDEGECPECGSQPIERNTQGEVVAGGEYRFLVPTPGGGRTYCRRCVPDDELLQLRQKQQALQATKAPRGGRR